MRLLFFIFLLPFSLSSQTQVGQFINGTSPELTGESVSISEDGKTIAIGSPIFNGEDYFYAGIVRVFELKENIWVQKGNAIEGEKDLDNFGFTVILAKNGSRLLTSTYLGDIRIFDFDENENWIEIGRFESSQDSIRINYASISFSNNGNRIAFEITNLISHLDKVEVYEYDGDCWKLSGNPFFEEIQKDFIVLKLRTSLSHDGNVLHVSDVEFNSNLFVGTGKLCSFKYEEDSWTQMGECLLGEGIDDQFGFSHATNQTGDVIIIGGPSVDPNLKNDKTVKIFEFKNDEWIQKGNAIEHDNLSAYFGNDVEISADGNVVAIPAERDSTNGGFSGQVKLYEFIEDVWVQKGAAINGDFDEFCGRSISLSADGTILAVGCPRFGIDRGEVRVYDYSMPLSNNNIQAIEKLDIHPNPASNYIHFKTKKKSNSTFKIYNQVGVLLLSDTYDEHVDIRFLPPGIYFLQIVEEGVRYKAKFVKQ